MQQNTVKNWVLLRPIWPHLFMALFGAGWAISFDVGVRLYGAEIITVVGLALTPWRSVFSRYPMLVHVLGAYALWAIAIILSDAINNTPLFISARNLATPIIGGASLVFVLAALTRNPSSLLTFLAAVTLTKGFLGESSYGQRYQDETLSWDSVKADTNFFKVRIDPFLTPALLLLGCWLGRQKPIRAGVAFFLASICYFAVDARSSGLMFFLSALALFAVHIRFRPRPIQLVIGGMTALVFGYLAYVVYVDYTLTYNPNGHNGRQLQRVENPYNPLALLEEGRSEWLVMPTAIAERPLFGWGSWAEDKNYRFTYMRMQKLGEHWSIRNAMTGYQIFIPVHSLIGAAWLWSGFLGFLAMIWLFRCVVVLGVRLTIVESPLLPAAFFLLFLFFWHFFFSPPQVVRLGFPVALATLILLTRSAPSAELTNVNITNRKRSPLLPMRR